MRNCLCISRKVLRPIIGVPTALSRILASFGALDWLAFTLLCVHAALLTWGAWRHSPTVDEVSYLPAGMQHWSTGEYSLARVSPPLTRLIAALPLLVTDTQTDWRSLETVPGTRSDRQVGQDFLHANRERSLWLFSIARCACVPLSLFGALICYRWATDLYGPLSGVLAIALWCFSPNIIAHGQLVTPDVTLASLGVAACYANWRWLRHPTCSSALMMGTILGFCELAKTTAVIYGVSWPLLWIMRRWMGSAEDPTVSGAKQLAQLLLAFVVALVILNWGYQFHSTGEPLGSFEFVSETLAGPRSDELSSATSGNRFSGSWLGMIPVPLPADYVLGIDMQKLDFGRTSRSYLGGTFKRGGWWYYYLYGMAVKVPLGTWLLLGLAIGVTCLRPSYNAPWRDEIPLFLPALLILMFVSAQTGFSHHVRYVLPIAPFCFVLISKVANAARIGAWPMQICVAAAVAWSVASSLYVYPHSLSYFNELAGGPRNGHQHLINSNIDWGQDLIYLSAWLDRNPRAKPLHLAFYGGFSPRLAGIKFTLPPSGEGEVEPRGILRRGWYAVSVNLLRGHYYHTFDRRGRQRSVRSPIYSYFLTREPVGTAGYSIYIYHLTANDVRQLTGPRPDQTGPSQTDTRRRR